MVLGYRLSAATMSSGFRTASHLVLARRGRRLVSRSLPFNVYGSVGVESTLGTQLKWRRMSSMMAELKW